MTSFPLEIPTDHHATQSGDTTLVRSTKQKHVSERDFSKWFGKNWLGFGSRIEPGLGGDVGNPDWIIQPESTIGLLGVELKIGKVVGPTLYLDEVQPSQVSWHSRLAMQGGVSLFLVHTSDGVFVFDGTYANQWEDGYSITGGEADGAYQLNTASPEAFSAGLEKFIEDLIMEGV